LTQLHDTGKVRNKRNGRGGCKRRNDQNAKIEVMSILALRPFVSVAFVALRALRSMEIGLFAECNRQLLL